MRLTDDELRAALRTEAAAHRPDREAMLDRLDLDGVGMAATGSAPRRQAPRGSRARMAAAATAVVALFAGGGFANWALAGSADNTAPAPIVVPSVAPTTAAPSPAAPPPATASSTAAPPEPALTTAKPTPKPPKSPKPAEPARTKGRPGYTRVEQGPLWSDGSVDPDSGDTRGASIVTLKTTETLTALDVVIRVARTGGLVSRGGTKRTPGASVTASVTESGDALLYRFTLAPADTLEPGTYTFTARYAHPPGGRDAGGDTYEAVSGALDVYGNFF